jgi:hypothetical protein
MAEARRHITGNRREIEDSSYAGCIACCAVFDADDVQAWQDERNSPEKLHRTRRWTARCPRCGQPAVIGSSTGLLDDQAYLPVINHIWTGQVERH